MTHINRSAQILVLAKEVLTIESQLAAKRAELDRLVEAHAPARQTKPLKPPPKNGRPKAASKLKQSGAPRAKPGQAVAAVLAAAERLYNSGLMTQIAVNKLASEAGVKLPTVRAICRAQATRLAPSGRGLVRFVPANGTGASASPETTEAASA
jgi:hypothetical protein